MCVRAKDSDSVAMYIYSMYTCTPDAMPGSATHSPRAVSSQQSAVSQQSASASTHQPLQYSLTIAPHG